jgi:excisionase family DNA binding protein
VDNIQRDNAQIMSPEDLAKETGLGVHTVYRQLRKGNIPGAVKLGQRRWCVTRANYLKWINGESTTKACS